MRLFIAVHFTAEIKKILLDAEDEIRAQTASANITRPENLHLTLAFIGETESAAAAKAAIDECVRPSFTLTVGGSGRFGDLWWAGIDKNPDLAALAEAIQEALRRRGFAIERKPFRPHITLARWVESASPIRLMVPRASMTVRRVSLMKSERINGKLTYTELYGKDLT